MRLKRNVYSFFHSLSPGILHPFHLKESQEAEMTITLIFLSPGYLSTGCYIWIMYVLFRSPRQPLVVE